MPTYYSLTLLAMGLIATNSAIADIAESTQTYAAIKIATISNMYQQDVSNQGMDNYLVMLIMIYCGIRKILIIPKTSSFR